MKNNMSFYMVRIAFVFTVAVLLTIIFGPEKMKGHKLPPLRHSTENYELVLKLKTPVQPETGDNINRALDSFAIQIEAIYAAIEAGEPKEAERLSAWLREGVRTGELGGQRNTTPSQPLDKPPSGLKAAPKAAPKKDFRGDGI